MKGMKKEKENKCCSLEGGETWAADEPASTSDSRLENKQHPAEG